MNSVHSKNTLIQRELFSKAHWSYCSINARAWLSAAMLYFVSANDAEPDFSSPIGFEDDAEVLNACLKLAHLDELLVRPEDYDDA